MTNFKENHTPITASYFSRRSHIACAGISLRNSPYSKQGFTLVELLIALVLVGMILLILFSGLNLATRSSEAAEQITQEVEKLRVVESLLRRQLHEARLLFYEAPEQGQRITFIGQPHAMQFVTPLLEHLGLGGLYWITVGLAEEGNKGRLMMRWRPYRPNEPFEQEAVNTQEPELLLDSVKEAEFSYFGVLVLGEEPDWHNHWDNPQQPPQLISLRIRTEDGAWPELLLGLRTSPFDNSGGISRQLRIDFGP